MYRYIPDFILHNYQKKRLKGTISAYVLLFDIANFTSINVVLQKEGKKGAEELRKFLDLAFGEPIRIVNRYGGFVVLFAGDAVLTIFPNAKPEMIMAAVNSISSFFSDKSIYKTSFGDFDLKMRQTICYGKVNWQIYENELQNEYIFFSDTMQELSELSHLKKDTIFSAAVAKRIGINRFERIEGGYLLISQEEYPETMFLKFDYKREILTRFINKKYSSDTPQDEIRSAAYCFINLENIKPDRREQAIKQIQILADRYGGFVNKYDATDKGLVGIILFGLPKSEGKTLERICRFALDATIEIPKLAMGISSGRVFAGFTGSEVIREYTAMGHPMNLAARLMQKAKPGWILTDSYLCKDEEINFTFKYKGKVRPRGIDEDIRYYRLRKANLERFSYHENSFVGRNTEIASIKRIISKSFKTNTNTIIYVLGEPGIGKSRLVKEVLASYSEKQLHKFFVYCDGIICKPHELIKQIIRSFFEFKYEDDTADNIRKYRKKWKRLAKDDKELLRIESIIAAMIGLEWHDSNWEKIEQEDRPDQLKRAFLTFIRQISHKKPVLIHLDDAQWIDPYSNDYFQFISDSDVKRVAFIAACRYLDGGKKPDLQLSKHEHKELDLNVLSDTCSMQLIKVILKLKRIPEETTTLINSHAAGNPFYIEQIILYLKENGKLGKKGELTGEVGYLSAFGINDIIGFRVDSLTDKLRECISHASVLGMEFNVTVLSRMLNDDLNDDLKDELDTGTSNRIWKDLDELRYIFSHIMIKDVVYERLMSDKLQKLHQTAAEAMEIVFSEKLDEHAEEIAHHFVKGNEFVKAAEYMDKTGNWYRDKCLFDLAETNLKDALETRKRIMGADNPDISISIDNLATLYRTQNKYEEAEDCFNQVLKIRERYRDTNPRDYAYSKSSLAALYRELGKFDEAEVLYLEALEIRKHELGEDDQDTALAYTNLAALYREQCKFKQAEFNYRKSLDIREKVLGHVDPATAAALGNLGALYRELCIYDQSEKMHKRALDIREKKYGKDHKDIAQSCNSLALLYREQGKYKKAEKLYKRALTIREKVRGKEHPDTAAALSNLAAFYREQGKYAEAESLHIRALKIREKIMGTQHHITAKAYTNLAALYRELALYQKAENFYLIALEISKKVGGQENPDTATAMSNLAALYRDWGLYDKAETYHEEALEIRKKVMKEDHPDTAQSFINLAALYRELGKYDFAESYYKQALAIRISKLGEDHQDTASAVSNLAALYRDMKRYQEADQLHERALKIRVKVFGEKHPDTAQSMVNLAALYRELGKFEQAESLYQKAYQIREELFGTEHPDTASALSNLAALYRENKAYQQAGKLYQKALEIREKVLGEKHPDTAKSLSSIALLFRDQEDFEQAEKYHKRALKIREAVLNPNHPDIAKSLSNLAALYKQTGDYNQSEMYYLKALKIRTNLFGDKNKETRKSLRGLTDLYKKTGNLDKALEYQARLESVM